MASRLVNKLEDRIRRYEVYGANTEQEIKDVNLLRETKKELMRLERIETDANWIKHPDRMGQ